MLFGGTTFRGSTIGIVGMSTVTALVSLAVAVGGAGAVKKIDSEYKILESGPAFVPLARE
jgi:hypothetical protein